MQPRIIFFTLSFAALWLAGCSNLLPSGGGGGGTSAPLNQITYEGPLTVSIKSGQTLAGTDLIYQGKSADGRALLVIGGAQAPKSTADSVNYTGSPVPGTLLTLTTRVVTYDDKAVNLIGTVHVTVQDPQPQADAIAPEAAAAFSVPVEYTVRKNGTIPGSTAQYLGKTDQGAQFGNIGQFPFIQQGDSVVWIGHLREKIALRLDLRLINSSDANVLLIGTAQIRFEK